MQSTKELLESKKLNLVVKQWIDAGRQHEVYKKANYFIDGHHEKFYDAIQFMYDTFSRFNQSVSFSI